ncbi:MAG TPA: acyltransferase [Streptosporangiaceae bacterium]|nr:acyltransferase [Streptosporangiaceae bacterium]
MLTRTPAPEHPSVPGRRAAGSYRSRPHADELDVVRPVASVLVIATHAMQMLAPTASIFYGAITLGSQASRHIFFFVSALTLTYQAYQRPHWSPWRFWGRRGTGVVIPYAIWTLLYVAVSFAGLQGDAISGTSGSLLQIARNAGLQLISGSGHLYYVFVLMQFYLLFPVLLWLLNRTRRWPAVILVASLGIQVWVSFALHYQHWSPQVWYDINSTREVTSYVFYLVAGMVIGAHLPVVRAWVWRHRWLLLAAGTLVLAAVEAWFVLTVRSGQAPTAAADPFEPEAIPLYAAAILLLWLAGAWWAHRSRNGWPSRLVAATSDNSMGVYLSHIMFLDALVTLGLGGLSRRVPWIITVLLAVTVTWLAATAFTEFAARTPVSRWLVGRARRPLTLSQLPAERARATQTQGAG